MKLKLVNFLCYENIEIDLGENGISLLSGHSGSGKTSILKAIFFALFGEGNKLQMYGKTSCSVELYFDDIKIVRTKRPNRLIVNDMYEDASGQEIIDKKFGNTFKTSGYIQQNNLSSFMMMSPIDKLEFLEKFAFKDVDIGKIKNRTKSHIQKRNENLISVNAQLDTTKKMIQELKLPPKVDFPLSYKKESHIPKLIKNQKIKTSNLNILSRKAEKLRKKIEKELQNTKILNASITSKMENNDRVINKISEIENILQNTNFIGEEKLEEYHEELKICLQHKELIDLQTQKNNNNKQLEEMKNTEIQSMNEEIENIQKILWCDYSKEEVVSNISELKLCLINLEKINKLKTEIENNTITQETLKQKQDTLEVYNQKLVEDKALHQKMTKLQNIYSCPCCNTNLKFINDSLVVSDDIFGSKIDSVDLDKLEDDIENLTQDINKINKLITIEETTLEHIGNIKQEIESIKDMYQGDLDYEEIKQDLEYLLDYKNTQQVLEKKLKDIQGNLLSENFSGSYKAFRNNIENINENLNNLREKCKSEPKYEEEFLRNIICEQTIIFERNKDLNKELDNLLVQKRTIRDSINELEDKHKRVYQDINSIEDLEKGLQEQEDTLSELSTKINEQEKIINLVDNWEKYQLELSNYNNFKDKIISLEQEERNIRSEYAGAMKLRDKILEAESLAMTNIIDSINSHARIYLDYFFEEYPISVQLQTFKETKETTKPKINVSVDYKGMDTDLTALSGGELSRVVLAYTLALAEIFNTPLILLDEITSNLDQELSTIVFDAIRENFNGKQTIAVAHQVVKGCFDKVIEIGS
jgi:exonuclease SbcC